MLSISAVNFDDHVEKWGQPQTALRQYIISYVLQGQVYYWVNGQKLLLEKGDFLFMTPGTIRQSSNAFDQLHQKFTVIFNIDDHKMKQLNLVKENKHKLLRIKNHEYIKQRLAHLHQHFSKKNQYYNIICEGLLLELLGQINQEVDMAYLSPEKVSLANRIEDFIQKHYKQEIGVNDMASYINKTNSYTIRLFRQVKGQTPIEYLRQIRISQAKELLVNTSMSLSEIAEELCFYDAPHFIRVYKRLVGEVPSVIRQQDQK
jgi:AraC family transcriptional regulator of arabinose operon